MSASEKVTPAVCVVGSGARFLSGISYYTHQLSIALAQVYPTSVILMRQLLPTKLYPGRKRVGRQLAVLDFTSVVEVIDGIDWYWGYSFIRAVRMLVRRRPQVIVFQWWTGTVLHTYIALAALSRILGVKVILEFHEVLDTSEDKIPAAKYYVNALMPLLIKLASAFVIHSESDRSPLMTRYKLSNRPISVILHGPYDQYHTGESREKLRNAPVDCCNILFFGVIRPFKGLEDLVMAFNRIPEDQIDDYWLTIAGEPWEGWSLPFELIEQSRYRERITLIREYVADSDIPGIFAGADVVALPYHRSSASGPLHIAMSWGLPIITTEVGGLPEAVTGYEGAILVPPAKPEAILEAIPRARDMQGSKYASHHSWNNTVNAYSALFEDIGIL